MGKIKYFTEEERKKAEIASKVKYRNSHKEERNKYRKEYDKTAKGKISLKRRHINYYKTPMGRAVNLINAYKQNDKKYNRGECTLTSQWIVDNIFAKKCVYCGETDWTKLGCDRKNNSKPHTENNVVPCCKTCNKKRGTKSFEQFLAECTKKDLG